MCLSNEAAAIKLAERDNLVGELVVMLIRLRDMAPLSAVLYSMRDELDSLIAKAREGARS